MEFYIARTGVGQRVRGMWCEWTQTEKSARMVKSVTGTARALGALCVL